MPKRDKEIKVLKEEMTLEEAKAYRASLHKKPATKLSEQQKRDKFKLFWAQSKKKYGKTKSLEEILWMHLKGTGNDEPEKFEAGIAHFGLKKIG